MVETIVIEKQCPEETCRGCYDAFPLEYIYCPYCSRFLDKVISLYGVRKFDSS